MSTIILKGNPIRKEGVAAAEITPGMLLTYDESGNLIPHDVAGGTAAPMFAVEQDYIGGSITDTYAVGDQVAYVIPRPGDEIYAILKQNENVVVGDFLESGGSGTLRKLVSGGPATLITGDEGSNNAILWTARCPGSAGNDISVELVDPNGNDQSLAVTVTGNKISVSLATDSGGAITSTAANIIAAIEGDAGANALVTVANAGESDGTGVVSPVAETALSGGVDVTPNSIVARALEDLNPTSEDGRINVEVM
ncbi:MAG: hypothetical protein JRD89_02700 [Deltaproteobacteria bacterium]|nr:hypothetical protein [Deltaproteobacteria bacterium]